MESSTLPARYEPGQVEAYRREGYWGDDHLVDHLDRTAEVDPARLLVSDGSGSLTYGQARGQAYRLAAALRNEGVLAGDRVLVQLPNWGELVVTYCALARIGAVMVPVMPVYRDHEVGYVLANTEAVAVVTCGEFRNFDHAAMFRELRRQAPWLRTIVVARGSNDPATSAFEALAGERTDPAVPTAAQLGPRPAADDAHLIIYTSGTESRPKGCLHTWNTVAFTLRASVRMLELTADDVSFVPSPATHTTGLAMGVALPITSGGGIHLLDRWEPQTALGRIAEHRCTHTTTAATFLQTAVEAFDPGQHDLSSMRVWISGGAPIPPSLVHTAAERFSGCQVLAVYGRTETLTTSQSRLTDTIDDVASFDGQVIEGVEVSIRDPDGVDLPAGAEGEICYRGPGLMIGYWRAPKLTTAAGYAGGWSRSGDLGRLNDRGYLRVTGRLKDVIVRGGTNISALELENELLRHPDIRAAAVVGEPDERLGERVCAFLALHPDRPVLKLPDLVSFLRDERKIAIYKLPQRVICVDELPTSASGKLQKQVLRERLRGM